MTKSSKTSNKSSVAKLHKTQSREESKIIKTTMSNAHAPSSKNEMRPTYLNMIIMLFIETFNK